MDDDFTTEEYASFFPKSIRLAFENLGNPNNDKDISFAILSLLLHEDDTLERNEIKNALSDTPEETIEDELDNLQTGGLVVKWAGEKIGDPATGGYEVTDFGEAIVDGIYESTTPNE